MGVDKMPGRNYEAKQGKRPKTEPQRTRIMYFTTRERREALGVSSQMCSYHQTLSFSFPAVRYTGILMDTLMTVIMGSYTSCTYKICNDFF